MLLTSCFSPNCCPKPSSSSYVLLHAHFTIISLQVQRPSKTWSFASLSRVNLYDHVQYFGGPSPCPLSPCLLSPAAERTSPTDRPLQFSFAFSSSVPWLRTAPLAAHHPRQHGQPRQHGRRGPCAAAVARARLYGAERLSGAPARMGSDGFGWAHYGSGEREKEKPVARFDQLGTGEAVTNSKPSWGRRMASINDTVKRQWMRIARRCERSGPPFMVQESSLVVLLTCDTKRHPAPASEAFAVMHS